MLRAAFLFLCVQGVYSTGTAFLKLLSYDTVMPRGEGGGPCDGMNFLPCEPFFDFCFSPTNDLNCDRLLTFPFSGTTITYDRLPALVVPYDFVSTATLVAQLRDMDRNIAGLQFHVNTLLGETTFSSVLTNEGAFLRAEEDLSTGNGFHNFRISIGARCDEFFFGADCSIRCEPTDSPLGGHFTCDTSGNPVCLPGFQDPSTAPPCITPVDPCAVSPCQNGGACSDAGSGNFVCDCTGTGFSGDTCTDNINECDFSPCVNGGSCSDGATPTTFVCACLTGFTGPRCETLDDLCLMSPCVNGGTCYTESPGVVRCFCPTGFDGANCDNDIDECSQNPCQNGGVCTQTSPTGFSCACLTGFNGPLCEGFDSPCLNRPCKNGGSCTSSGPGDFSCACVPGYSGNTCEIFVDSCENEPCQNGGTCKPVVNGFVCCCKRGYIGSTCETFCDFVNLNELAAQYPYIPVLTLVQYITDHCPNVTFLSPTRVKVTSIQDRNCLYGFYSDKGRQGGRADNATRAA